MRQRGFTLLEVMIALAILGLSLVAISRSHQNSIRAANRSRLTTVATLLARYKLVEVEDKLFEEGFSDFKQEEKQTFKEDGFERFSYTLVVDKVELPSNVNADSIKGALGSASGAMTGVGSERGSGKANDPAAKMGAAANMGASVLASQFEMIRNVLEQSIRRASLKVEWKEGSQKHEVTVVGYFTDPRKIDAALGGLGGLGALGGTTGTTGTTGTGGTTGTTGTTGTGGTTGTSGIRTLTPTVTPTVPRR